MLGVPRGATDEDIRKAYRRLARKHHPDANPNAPHAEERFKEIQQAHEILSNPKKRRAYDERSRTSPQRSTGSPRVATSGRPRERTTGSVDLSGLLGKFGSSSGGRKEVSWQLRVEDTEDIARISKILGVDLARLAKLAGKDVRMKASASFEDGGATSRNAAADGMGRKPRKPPIPPKPPKTRKPPDAP
ncbi:MAG TPA: DnaJ domain-containing protein [Rubrobacter sp.]|nr:DnaJ domain-containing protein [Rubrobacter sp.]